MGRYDCCDHLGNEYKSVREMCKAFNVSPKAFYKRKKMGLSTEECLCGNNDFHNRKNRVVTDHLGNTFDSEKEMCRYHQVDYQRYQGRKARGLDIERCLQSTVLTPEHKSKLSDGFGNSFTSLSQLCEHYNVAYNTVKRKLKQGQSIYSILKTYSKLDRTELSTDYTGRTFKCVQDMCKFYDISPSVYRRRLKNGMSKEEALTTPSKHKDYNCGKVSDIEERTDHKGVIYEGKSAMLRHFGIGWNTYKRAIANGESKESILSRYEDKLNQKYIREKTNWNVEKLLYTSENGNMFYLCSYENIEEVLSIDEIKNSENIKYLTNSYKYHII